MQKILILSLNMQTLDSDTNLKPHDLEAWDIQLWYFARYF